jgi:hypothetical protein
LVSAVFLRRTKAGILMLAAFAVIAMGLAPLCTALCCPPAPAELSIHASMPCCAGKDSMSRSEEMRVEHSTAAAARVHVPPPAMAVAITVSQPAPPAFRREAARVLTRHDPSPPLFLLNAQFLI